MTQAQTLRQEAARLYEMARMPVRWSQRSAFEARARMKRRADRLMDEATALDGQKTQSGICAGPSFGATFRHFMPDGTPVR